MKLLIASTPPPTDVLPIDKLEPSAHIGIDFGLGDKGVVLREVYRGATFAILANYEFAKGNCYQRTLSWEEVIKYLLTRINSKAKVYVFDTDRELLQWFAQ